MKDRENSPDSYRGVSDAQNRKPEKSVLPRVGGIDTVSFAFHLDQLKGDGWSDFQSLINQKNGEINSEAGPLRFFGGELKGFRVQNPLPGGIRWGFIPRSKSFWVEGRMGPMLTGDKENIELMPAVFLVPAALRAASDLADLLELDLSQIYSSKACGLRRLDIASEISCSPFYGQQLLRGFSQVSFGGSSPVVSWAKEGRQETIYLMNRSGKSVRFRIYDKAVESGSSAPGTRLRFERQMRWTKREQPLTFGAGTTGNELLLEKWREGYEPFLGKDETLKRSGLVVCGWEKAADEILRKAESGEISLETGERLAGALMVRRIRGEGWWKEQGRDDVGYRRIRALRSLGIVIGKTEEPVDLGEALRVAGESLAEPPAFISVVPDRKRGRKGLAPWDRQNQNQAAA